MKLISKRVSNHLLKLTKACGRIFLHEDGEDLNAKNNQIGPRRPLVKGVG